MKMEHIRSFCVRIDESSQDMMQWSKENRDLLIRFMLEKEEDQGHEVIGEALCDVSDDLKPLVFSSDPSEQQLFFNALRNEVYNYMSKHLHEKVSEMMGRIEVEERESEPTD